MILCPISFMVSLCCLFQQILFIKFDAKEWRIKYILVQLAIRHIDMHIHHQCHRKKPISKLSIINSYPTRKQQTWKKKSSILKKEGAEIKLCFLKSMWIFLFSKVREMGSKYFAKLSNMKCNRKALFFFFKGFISFYWSVAYSLLVFLSLHEELHIFGSERWIT